MKLSRVVRLIVALVWMAILGSTARAATVETKARTIMRDKPNAAARIVDRVAAGKKLPMLGMSGDGNWVHVRAGTHEGWVAAASIKGLHGNANSDDGAGEEDTSGDGDEPVRPLAKKRGVRPEAWVSKSRYHEGEETKLIVSVNKAELFGRPSATGAVLGILRRGEQVQLVKKSVDKKWINVDIGGGETAWIEARAVKPGKVQTLTPPPDESAQEEEAPPPTITPEGAKKKGKFAKAEPPPPADETPTEQPAAETPPPTKKVIKKQTSSEDEPPPPPKKRRVDSEDETPPGLAPTKHKVVEATPKPSSDDSPPPSRKKKQKKRQEAEAAPAPADETPPAADYWSARGKVYITPWARAGIAILTQRFTSNGSGPLSNYDASTNAFGAQLGFGVFATLGKYFLFGADGSYTFAGAAAIKIATTSTPVTLAVQAHTIDGGVSAGLHFRPLGGVSVRLRVGGQLQLNLVQPSNIDKLPSDRIVGLTIGAGVGIPALFRIASLPFGLQVIGGGLVPAQRAQTVGLEDGKKSSTFGAFFGGGVSQQIMKPNAETYHGSLTIDVDYAYNFAATHYTGLSPRLAAQNVTVADRGSAQHLLTLGLTFTY